MPPMTSITHTTLEGAEGVALHVAQAGAAGRLMLFLHGFPEFWQAWHRQLAAFSVGNRAVAVDLRGYNRSEKPTDTEAYALPKIVGDLRCLLHRLSPDQPAVVIGHDWGGIAAWALAREAPHLIHRLVIINAPHPVLFFRELKTNPAQMIASSYAAFFQLPLVAEAFLRAFDFAALRRMVFGLSVKPEMFPPELRSSYREAWRQPGALHAGLNYYRNVRTFTRLVREPESWRIAPRTLVLWGDKDPSLRPSNLLGLDHFVSNLAVKRHAAATHWIVHEEPEWVNAAIRAFVE